MNNDEYFSGIITDAPTHLTVAEVEADERRGIAWPISGDETTIYTKETRP